MIECPCGIDPSRCDYHNLTIAPPPGAYSAVSFADLDTDLTAYKPGAYTCWLVNRSVKFGRIVQSSPNWVRCESSDDSVIQLHDTQAQNEIAVVNERIDLNWLIKSADARAPGGLHYMAGVKLPYITRLAVILRTAGVL